MSRDRIGPPFRLSGEGCLPTIFYLPLGRVSGRHIVKSANQSGVFACKDYHPNTASFEGARKQMKKTAKRLGNSPEILGFAVHTERSLECIGLATFALNHTVVGPESLKKVTGDCLDMRFFGMTSVDDLIPGRVAEGMVRLHRRMHGREDAPLLYSLNADAYSPVRHALRYCVATPRGEPLYFEAPASNASQPYYLRTVRPLSEEQLSSPLLICL